MSADGSPIRAGGGQRMPRSVALSRLVAISRDLGEIAGHARPGGGIESRAVVVCLENAADWIGRAEQFLSAGE